MLAIILRGNRMHSAAAIEIERAELFRALEPAARARLREAAHAHRFTRHARLYVEGEPAARVWIVRSGEVRLYKSSPGGQVTTLDLLGPGELFGALSALPDETYPSSAEVVAEASVWWLPRDAFLRALREDPRAALELLEVVSRRLRQAHERLRAFAHDPAPARLARALLAAARDGTAHATRRALAEAAGTTVETAIRVLRRFEAEGLVKGEVGALHLLAPQALREIAGGV
jgi:CRP/FNR family transcriptional regulator